MLLNSLPRVMKQYFPNWQKELWQTFEETSGYVRPERVNRWPNSMTYRIYDDKGKGKGHPTTGYEVPEGE
jgi:hypothetical protein